MYSRCMSEGMVWLYICTLVSGSIAGLSVPMWSVRRVSSCPYLYPGLGQFGPLGQLLPGVDVGVVGPLERLLQLPQLLGAEVSPTAALLPLHGKPGLGLRVRITCNKTTT